MTPEPRRIGLARRRPDFATKTPGPDQNRRLPGLHWPATARSQRAVDDADEGVARGGRPRLLRTASSQIQGRGPCRIVFFVWLRGMLSGPWEFRCEISRNRQRLYPVRTHARWRRNGSGPSLNSHRRQLECAKTSAKRWAARRNCRGRLISVDQNLDGLQKDLAQRKNRPG